MAGYLGCKCGDYNEGCITCSTRELQEAYDIAMKEIARLRKLLGYDSPNPTDTPKSQNKNNQQVNTEDRGNTSPSLSPRKKDEPLEGGCDGESLAPAGTINKLGEKR